MQFRAKPLVLVADDDAELLGEMDTFLRRTGCSVICAKGSSQLRETLTNVSPDLLFLDLRLGDDNGLEVFSGLLQNGLEVPVVFMAEHGTIDSAVAAIKMGAFDFLEKPVDDTRLRDTMSGALEKNLQDSQSDDAPSNYAVPALRSEMLGQSAEIERVRQLVSEVAPTELTVLILGENGTGKELVARAIHANSRRASRAFVPVDIGALPPTLIETTLFGHEKGSFTGAYRAKRGSFESAHNGTVFLDEIGELALELQPKLMRFLQEQTVHRVGSNSTRQVDVRIVAATNRDVDSMMESGRLREDLYYRLNIFPIVVPPLRSRGEDIEILAKEFLHRSANRNGKRVRGFTPAALEILTHYDWPGNVRQLENLVDRLLILCHEEEIGAELLPPELLGGHHPASDDEPNGRVTPRGGNGSGLTRMELLEREAIVKALAKANGHVVTAARELGVGQATMYRKLRKYRIKRK